jgi:predicted DNA-binding mobile mystery protein A
MNKRSQELTLHQTDALLAPWQNLRTFSRPEAGWVHAIRRALGVSAAALARRLGMTHAGVHHLERAETEEVITLASLKKLADALDCELHYALVPRSSLEQTLKNRALLVARERLRPASPGAKAPQKATAEPVAKEQLEALVDELLAASRRGLWW